MKHKNVVFSILLVFLVVAAFNVGQAYASLCFSDTHTVAICWLKNNGIAAAYADGTFRPLNYLTRGDAAVFLFRANKVPPASGDLFFTQSLSSVVPNGIHASTASVAYFSDMNQLKSSITGVNYFQISLAIPVSLYGKALSLKGVQVCYNATNGASITQVELQRWINVAGDPAINGIKSDITIRTDKACRQYNFAAPVTLAGSNHVALILIGNFSTTNSWIGIDSITAVLSPTTNSGSLTLEESLSGEGPGPDPATLSGAMP